MTNVLLSHADTLLDLYAKVQAETDIIDTDRECFTKDEGRDQWQAVADLRRACGGLLTLARDMGGADVDGRMARLQPPPPEPHRVDPSDVDSFR